LFVLSSVFCLPLLSSFFFLLSSFFFLSFFLSAGGGGGVQSTGSVARRQLHRLNKSLKLLQALSSSSSSSSSTPSSLPHDVPVSDLDAFQRVWQKGLLRASTVDGDVVVLNTLECHDFGYKHGQLLRTAKGQ
jgi:hypothetical protein